MRFAGCLAGTHRSSVGDCKQSNLSQTMPENTKRTSEDHIATKSNLLPGQLKTSHVVFRISYEKH